MKKLTTNSYELYELTLLESIKLANMYLTKLIYRNIEIYNSNEDTDYMYRPG